MSQVISENLSPRIAFVTGSLTLGGTTTFLCNLAGELVRRQIPAAVFSLNQDHPLASDFKAQNIPVRCEDASRYIFEDCLEQLLAHLAAFQPTVVVANLSANSFEALRYVPKGILRVGMVHSDDSHWYAMIRHYANDLELVAVVSETIQTKLADLPEFRSQTVAHLPCGVPMATTPRTFSATAPLRILYLGRLAQEQKRVRLFPRILAQLQAANISFHWTVAGDGPDRAFLESAMKSTQAGQTVEFPGAIAYAEVPRMLAAHDIFLLASDYEGLPLSLLEAMGSGAVPVITDLPSGVRQVVDHTTGKLVAPHDIEGYARAIIGLHEHRSELQQLSQKARERVQCDYSVAAMTDRWLGVLSTAGTNPAPWPTRRQILPPRVARLKFYYSRPIRLLRRLRMRLRRRVSGQ